MVAAPGEGEDANVATCRNHLDVTCTVLAPLDTLRVMPNLDNSDDLKEPDGIDAVATKGETGAVENGVTRTL